MKQLAIAFAVILLILGGVALATAADVPQAPNAADLSGFQKLTDQEAKEIRGTGISFGIQSTAITSALQPRTQSQVQTSYDNSPVGFQQCPRDRTQELDSIRTAASADHNSGVATGFAQLCSQLNYTIRRYVLAA